MNNDEQEQTPLSPPPSPPQTPQSPPIQQVDTETEETNSDTTTECCNDYECPPQPEPEKCDSYYVPIGVQLCPVVKLYVNKPKVCQVSKADCIPCFLEEK